MLPPGTVKPDYSGYCLANLPATLASFLGYKGSGRLLPGDAFGEVDTSGVENVIVILCDGFGYNEWQRQSDHGFFGALATRGNVRPITPVFPSTTSANLTSLATGLTPQEHGLPEWFVYMQEIGSVIVTLPFTRVGDPRRDSLVGTLSPKALFDGNTIYKRLKKAGIKSTSFTNRSLAHTAYSKISRAGSGMKPYSTASDLSVSLRHHVEKSRGSNYTYVYWSYVDTIEHIYGPGTDEALVEGSLISHALYEGFLQKLDRQAAKKTMVVVTADHGQVKVTPAETIYMNRFSKLTRNFQRNPSGEGIPPWGSARDSFILVEEDKLEESMTYLQKRLRGMASVIRTEDAIGAGLFGLGSPTRKFRRRVGNLMVLPHGNRMIWYKYPKDDKLDMGGHHGGLTRPEMTIPLAAARVSDLQ